MLLKQMIEAPKTSSSLVVYDPFQGFDRETLLKEIVGLANADVEGPRNILFGVNPGALNGSPIVGIPEEAIGELKRAHRLVSTMVEPALDLAFIFDRINGKLVGALEIDGCEFGPYFLAQDLSDELKRGTCWIREDREVTEVDRRSLLNGHTVATEEAALPALSPDDVNVSIGFNEDPDCEFIEVEVPDTSDPPFDEDGNDTGATTKTTKITQAFKDTVSTMTTQMLRLAKSKKSSDTESVDVEDFEKQIAEAARKHYFYEERAVKIDLCIRNDGDVDIGELRVELGCPCLEGFDIADRVYTSPFDKRSEAEVRKLGYPEVKRKDGAIFVRTTVEELEADKSRPLFRTSLRLAVGPKALGRKVALGYVLRGPDGTRLGDGRLKIRLGQKAKGEPSDAATHYRNLDDE